MQSLLIKKVPNLLKVVKGKIEQGEFLDTRHAQLRSNQRKITRPEILFVLKNGYHEKHKDKFINHYQSWNYAIRGKTVDKKDLRIIISFSEDKLVIVTAIEIKKET